MMATTTMHYFFPFVEINDADDNSNDTNNACITIPTSAFKVYLIATYFYSIKLFCFKRADNCPINIENSSLNQQIDLELRVILRYISLSIDREYYCILVGF
jgi:hypothetical protein